MLKKLLPFSLALLILTLALTACGAPPKLSKNIAASTVPAQELSKPTQEAESIMTGAKPSPKATISPKLQPVADEATTILSETLDAPPEDITILEVQTVTWSDASLGCPQPGMMYAQVITPGYLVKAEVDGETQMVHMNEKGHGVVCPEDQAKAPISAD